MKKISLIFVLFSALNFVSCSVFQGVAGKQEKMLNGTWQLNKIEFSSGEKNPDAENLINDMFKNSFVKFNPDKSVEMKMFEVKTSGTLTTDTGKIFIKENGAYKFEIQEISEDKLVLKYKENISLIMKK